MYSVDGPPESPCVVVLAPGDAGLAADPVPLALATSLAGAGVRVVRFDFPPCDTPSGAVRDGLLTDAIRGAARRCEPGHRLVLGGWSRGARVSVGLVDELGAVGVLALSYPFHPRHDPDPGDRVRALAACTVPILLAQGTRDSRGNRQQVRGYRLPPHVQMHWVEAANHALVPRPSSGLGADEALAALARVSTDFVTRWL